MKYVPIVYEVEKLVEQARVNTVWIETKYVPARPMGFWGLCLLTRLKAAWLVFTGKADVVKWTGQ